MKNFKKIVRMKQKALKDYLKRIVFKKYKDIITGDGYLYCKGNIPIMLTAHMDTVHKETVKNITTAKQEGFTVLSSPQGIGGDDRCGIWIIMEIIKRGYRPHVLFCEDEEIGRVGAKKFCETKLSNVLKEMKYIIELDRKGYNEAVFYDCGNADFQEYICKTTEYKFDYGSYSDICELSPKGDVASVNLSVGCYKCHTLDEYVVFEEMAYTVNVVEKLLMDEPNVNKFDFQEVVSEYDDWYWLSAYKKSNKKAKSQVYKYYDSYDYDPYDAYDELQRCFEVEYTKNGKTEYYSTTALSMDEAIGMWLQNEPKLNFSDNFVDIFEY